MGVQDETASHTRSCPRILPPYALLGSSGGRKGGLGPDYSIFEPGIVPPAGPLPWSRGWPEADDVDALAEVPEAGSGVIGATPPELAVVVVVGGVPSVGLLGGAGALGGVSVGPLKLIGWVPWSICGVTT